MHSEPENSNKPTNFSPLYQQIKALILEALELGQWKPGELIPSEIELAAKYRVSQGTVRKAVDELAGENFLVRKQGRGTFVATHQEEQAQYRFLRLEPDSGVTRTSSSKILLCATQKAPIHVSQTLRLEEGGEIIHIRRLLSFSKKPVVLEDIWLPGDTFSGLTTQVLANWQRPMYALFESKFGVHMVRASEKLKAVKADLLASEYLTVELGFPLLSVTRVSYTYGDRPVELRQAVYVTENDHYSNELS
jgi:GntR family transcriptional regulator